MTTGNTQHHHDTHHHDHNDHTHHTHHHTAPAFPLATALRHGLRGYNAQTLKHDFVAGIIVSLVALPLSMALAIAVGLPPQHGLYTAIVAGIACAVFGGSATQVSGPTAAFVVIVAPIVSDLGLHGIIWCQILAGALLILMGMTRMGKLIHLVPDAVTNGFTAGIAVTIATLSLNDFLGLGIEKLSGHYTEKAAMIISHLPNMNFAEFGTGLIALLLMIYFPRISKKIPAPIVGIGIATILAYNLGDAVGIDTLLSRFSYALPDGGTGHGIPPYAPVFHFPGGVDSLFKIPDSAELQILMMPALVIAALAALESLLSATVADKMAHTRHDPNAELNGIGIANIFSGLASGIPATGAIARTATNIHAGAKTPMAAIIHALLLLLYMLTLAPVISYMPMAALAALLLTTAWRMSHAHVFIDTLKHGKKQDIAILLTTFTLTVFIDMVAGVSAGMILAAMFYAHGRRKK